MVNTNRHAALVCLDGLLKDSILILESSMATDEEFRKLFHYFNYVGNIVETRGINILLEELPKFGKIFDYGLSSERISHKQIVDIGNNGLISAISALFQLTFRRTGDVYSLPDNPDPNIIFITRQILYFLKKLSVKCPDDRKIKTAEEFVEIDKCLRQPNCNWGGEWDYTRFDFGSDPLLSGIFPRSTEYFTIVDNVFRALIPMQSPFGLCIEPRHGPGAVADLKFGEDKYSFPIWPSLLNSVFHWTEYTQHRPDLHLDEDFEPNFGDAVAKLIAVPKDYTKPRLIASEPTAHQFIQQGLMKWLRDNMSLPLRTCINFTSQQPSRDAALLASASGNQATVDLSAASDRLSCWVVERALGSNQDLLCALNACRTTKTLIPKRLRSDGKDYTFDLRKFANQGSAVTFPIQSFVYAGICISTRIFNQYGPTKAGSLFSSRKWKKTVLEAAREVRVFGDDLVVPKVDVPLLSLALSSLELKVNGSKTHFDGYFRESCGMDAYKGYDVTPAYVTNLEIGRRSKNLESLVEVRNNFYEKGLWNMASSLEELIGEKNSRLIPTLTEPSPSLRFLSFSTNVVDQRSRWNEDLHLYEYRCLVPFSEICARERGSYRNLLQYFTEKPKPDTDWSSGFIYKKSSGIAKGWVHLASAR